MTTFWEGAGRGLAVEFACDMVLQGERVMVIGPPGSGVSTVLGEAAMRLVRESHVVRLDGRSTQSREDIFRSIRSVIGDDIADFVRDLDEHTLGMPLAIVVDNGHEMPPDAYAALLALRARLGTSLGILIGTCAEMDWLVSTTGWETLQREYLVPLNPDEVCQFLATVLGRAPDASAAALLWQASHGWPGRLLAQARQHRAVGVPLAELPWRHLLAAAGLVLLVAMLWLARPVREDATSLPVTLPDPEPVTQRDTPPHTATPVPQSRSDDQALPETSWQTSDSSKPPVRQAHPRSSEIVPAETVRSVPQRADVGTNETRPDSGYRSEEWLLMADGAHWVLQLAITSQEDAARAMVNHVGQSQAAYYRASRDGRVVFVVLSGTYPSREAAILARGDLPDDVRDAGPFPRQISTLHEEISDKNSQP